MSPRPRRNGKSVSKKSGYKKKRPSGSEQIIAALQISNTNCTTRLSLAHAEITLSKVVQLTSSLEISGNNKKVSEMSSSSLRPSTRALLMTESDDNEADVAALERILRRATITAPRTVQCMIDAMLQSQSALQELAPCQMGLQDFQSRCGKDTVQGAVLYKVVRQATQQCKDLEEYYRAMKVANQRFSGKTLPPFVDGYDDADLDGLSNRYWNCESEIQQMHKQSASAIDPGFAPEMVCILCHAMEVGSETSPLGLNLFEAKRNAVVISIL